MSKYQFTLDMLTIRDYTEIVQGASTGNVVAILMVADRCLPGGVLDRPVDELNDIMAAFAAAIQARFSTPKTPDDPNVTRLFRQALGDL